MKLCCIYICEQWFNREIKKTSSIYNQNERMKYLGINLTKGIEDLNIVKKLEKNK